MLFVKSITKSKLTTTEFILIYFSLFGRHRATLQRTQHQITIDPMSKAI